MSQENAEKNWARELSQGLISSKQLDQNSISTDASSAELELVEKSFHIRIPKIFAQELANGNHTLAKQFIPSKQELVFFPEELDDPIGDEIMTPVEGITHRYPDRVLLKPTYLCGVYCRFCFRRHKVSHAEHNLNEHTHQKALDYIRQNEKIWEVILTGGDPLVLTDQKLNHLFSELSSISHVKVIRLHSRILTVLPSRITTELIEIFQKSGKSVWIAVHANCAWEFTNESQRAIKTLLNNGIPLLLQSVLLKGVNDSFDQLSLLFKTAVGLGIKPYYLHYPDLAKGTHHFRIPLQQAISLFKELQGKVSGICLPKLIVDIPGAKGKISLSTHLATEIHDNCWQFESPITGEMITVDYSAYFPSKSTTF